MKPSLSLPPPPTPPSLSSTPPLSPSPPPQHHTSLSDTLIDFTRQFEAYTSTSPLLLTGYSLSIPAVAAVASFLPPSSHAPRILLAPAPDTLAKIHAARNVIDEKMAGGVSVYGVSTGFGGSADTRSRDISALGNALLQHQHAGILPTWTPYGPAGSGAYRSTLEHSHASADFLKTVPSQIPSVPSIAPYTASPRPLPPLDPHNQTSMPVPWVRGAILIRANSLVRGHSGVRIELIERMLALLERGITPQVPLRGSISASGDLSSLSYIAGTLTGNPSIRCWVPIPKLSVPRPLESAGYPQLTLLPSPLALSSSPHLPPLQPLSLATKEHLGILNGTAFSASLASLCVYRLIQALALGTVCTGMAVEAMVGSRGAFDAWIGGVRPHAGQIEVANILYTLLESSQLAQTEEKEVTIEEDAGQLRQDRYSLRTAPQWIGPLVEEAMQAVKTVTIEINSTTDNPLIDATTRTIHHGGNFQALSLTLPLDTARSTLLALSKLLFAQLTELVNPTTSRGLPPNLAATDPSVNYAGKGIEIGAASLVGEMVLLGGGVVGGVQNAELGNQSVNSLALLSARYTLQSLDILAQLTAGHIYLLCQALDLRAMQREFENFVKEETKLALEKFFGIFSRDEIRVLGNGDDNVSNQAEEVREKSEEDSTSRLVNAVLNQMLDTLDKTTSMDAEARMKKVVQAGVPVLVDYFSSVASASLGLSGSTLPSTCVPTATDLTNLIAQIPQYLSHLSSILAVHLHALRTAYLTGERGPAPAKGLLSRTRGVYLYVRCVLGVKMHGLENLRRFRKTSGEDIASNHTQLVGDDSDSLELGVLESTIGENVARIYESIRDGDMARVVAGMFEEIGVGI